MYQFLPSSLLPKAKEKILSAMKVKFQKHRRTGGVSIHQFQFQTGNEISIFGQNLMKVKRWGQMRRSSTRKIKVFFFDHIDLQLNPIDYQQGLTILYSVFTYPDKWSNKQTNKYNWRKQWKLKGRRGKFTTNMGNNKWHFFKLSIGLYPRRVFYMWW